MSEILGALLTMSVLALGAGLTYRMVARGQTRRLALAVVLGLAVAVVTLIVPGRAETKGDIGEIASVVFCYLCMLAGMMAEYFYDQGKRGRRRFRFELVTFLMPIFASPIVFIPLLTLTTDEALAGGAFTRAKLMVYLVAFQNGFFWRNFFEQRRLPQPEPQPQPQPQPNPGM
jgi:hypothetical protein